MCDLHFQVSDPIYNLDPTHKYNIQRRTTNLKISYYVKDSFSADFTGSLKKLEREVEDVYVQRLRDACFRERAYKVCPLYHYERSSLLFLFFRRTCCGRPGIVGTVT